MWTKYLRALTVAGILSMQSPPISGFADVTENEDFFDPYACKTSTVGFSGDRVFVYSDQHLLSSPISAIESADRSQISARHISSSAHTVRYNLTVTRPSRLRDNHRHLHRDWLIPLKDGRIAVPAFQGYDFFIIDLKDDKSISYYGFLFNKLSFEMEDLQLIQDTSEIVEDPDGYDLNKKRYAEYKDLVGDIHLRRVGDSSKLPKRNGIVSLTLISHDNKTIETTSLNLLTGVFTTHPDLDEFPVEGPGESRKLYRFDPESEFRIQEDTSRPTGRPLASQLHIDDNGVPVHRLITATELGGRVFQSFIDGYWETVEHVHTIHYEPVFPSSFYERPKEEQFYWVVSPNDYRESSMGLYKISPFDDQRIRVSEPGAHVEKVIYSIDREEPLWAYGAFRPDAPPAFFSATGQDLHQSLTVPGSVYTELVDMSEDQDSAIALNEFSDGSVAVSLVSNLGSSEQQSYMICSD